MCKKGQAFVYSLEMIIITEGGKMEGGREGGRRVEGERSGGREAWRTHCYS